jgi:hypothetical protein
LITIIASLEYGDDAPICKAALFVAEPIWKWQQTEAGQWIMENAIDRPSWHRHIDHTSYGYIYAIRADLTPEQLTYYKLKFE